MAQDRACTDMDGVAGTEGSGVAKAEWGTKRICPNCGARYYDMRKDPPVCPSCSTEFDPEALLRSRRARPIPADDTRTRAPVEVEDDEVAETEEAGIAGSDDEVAGGDIDEEADAAVADEEEDVLLEDASELGEEDDMGDVVDMEGEEEP